MNALGIVVLILIAFTVGYKIIGWLFDRVRGTPSDTDATSPTFDAADSQEEPTIQPGDRARSSAAGDASRPRTYEDPETRYARVLGLPRTFTAAEIKERYRTLIASYHPDKVNHLGPELRQMASQKTREILDAYEYFRVKYNLR